MDKMRMLQTPDRSNKPIQYLAMFFQNKNLNYHTITNYLDHIFLDPREKWQPSSFHQSLAIGLYHANNIKFSTASYDLTMM